MIQHFLTGGDDGLAVEESARVAIGEESSLCARPCFLLLGSRNAPLPFPSSPPLAHHCMLLHDVAWRYLTSMSTDEDEFLIYRQAASAVFGSPKARGAVNQGGGSKLAGTRSEHVSKPWSVLSPPICATGATVRRPRFLPAPPAISTGLELPGWASSAAPW